MIENLGKCILGSCTYTMEEMYRERYANFIMFVNDVG